MVHSSYFIRGYAIHGYFDVPVFTPATAACGCRSRTRAIFHWVQIGDRVDVYP